MLEISFKAEIYIDKISKDDRVLDGIIKSLIPDNVGVEETTRIEIYKREEGVGVLVDGKGKLGSFVHTMDDLLRCLAVSIRTLAGET